MEETQGGNHSNLIPVHYITPFCSDVLVSSPNLFPPCFTDWLQGLWSVRSVRIDKPYVPTPIGTNEMQFTDRIQLHVHRLLDWRSVRSERVDELFYACSDRHENTLSPTNEKQFIDHQLHTHRLLGLRSVRSERVDKLCYACSDRHENTLSPTNEMQFTDRIQLHTDRLLCLRSVRSERVDKLRYACSDWHENTLSPTNEKQFTDRIQIGSCGPYNKRFMFDPRTGNRTKHWSQR